VPQLAQVRDDVFFEVEACMVRTNDNAHLSPRFC
jgi:hypothetical protein